MALDIADVQTELENFINLRGCGKTLSFTDNFKIYFISTLIDKDFIIKNLQQMFFNKSIDFDAYFMSLAIPIDTNELLSNIEIEIIKGQIISIYKNQLYKISGAENIENRGVPDIEREASFEGGAEGFNETIETNINLVSQYYHSTSLVIKTLSVGTKGHNNLSLVYDSKYVDKNLLNEVIKKVTEINVDLVQSLNGLQQLLWKKQLLIPRMLVTQRPDRVTDYIGKGKIVFFLDGTPTALVLPVAFHDFMKTVDDDYLLPIPAVFLIFMRYLALILSIMMPASYVAIISYNPEVMRVQIALSIASGRIGVPYPSFIEVSIMLILMEFLIESSLRLPKTIGQTATTVGGLILGQAAIQAHLVSNIMVIIVSTVAISSFMIPVISMSLSIRVIKYGMLILSAFTGVYGILLGLYFLTYYLSSIHTFNVPYFELMNKVSINGFKKMLRKKT